MPATATVIFCPCYSKGCYHPTPHKPLSALAHAPNCIHKALEGLQDGFQQCPHWVQWVQLGSALLIFNSLWPQCPALSGLWPQLHVLSHDDCLRWMEAGEGSPETKGKKTDEKAFSLIYFSKIFNCQMHLLFPEVIILSSFLYDLAVTPGGGSNLFLALLF